MQSAIVFLGYILYMVLYRVLSFQVLHSWTRFTHHSCMNSCYSFMCTCILIIGYPWICIAMIDIIPYWCYPYVIPTFHVVIIHRLFFSCNSLHSLVSPLYLQGCYLSLGCAWPTIHFYHIEVRREECYIRNEKSVKTDIQRKTTTRYKRIVVQTHI